jgi:hypothetical protein
MVLKFVIQIDVVMQDAYKLVVRRPYIYIYIEQFCILARVTNNIISHECNLMISKSSGRGI